MRRQIEPSPFGHLRNDDDGARRRDRAREPNQLGVPPASSRDSVHHDPPGQRRGRSPRSQKRRGNDGAVPVQHDIILQQVISPCQPGPSVPEGSGKRDRHGESYPRSEAQGQRADDVDAHER